MHSEQRAATRWLQRWWRKFTEGAALWFRRPRCPLLLKLREIRGNSTENLLLDRESADTSRGRAIVVFSDLARIKSNCGRQNGGSGMIYDFGGGRERHYASARRTEH